jgi:hypothetical protein
VQIQQLRKTAQDVVGRGWADSQMESPARNENIFAVWWEKPGLSDDLGGLGERGERAWDKSGQGDHQATETD